MTFGHFFSLNRFVVVAVAVINEKKNRNLLLMTMTAGCVFIFKLAIVEKKCEDCVPFGERAWPPTISSRLNSNRTHPNVIANAFQYWSLFGNRLTT